MQLLFVHLIALLSLITVAVATPVPATLAVWLDPQNMARSQYQIPLLTWDLNLVQLAQQHTERCISGFPDRPALATAYTALTGLQAPTFGMNIGSGSPGTSRPSWLDQRNSWVCATNACTASSCGGYTQAIWSTSLRMGCAVSSCSGREYSICLYTPAGNMGTRHPLGNSAQCSVTGSPPSTVTPPPMTPPPMNTPSPVAPPPMTPPPPPATVPTPPSSTGTLVVVNPDVWIEPQNAARRAYNLNNFQYDSILVQLAQQHTDRCISGFPDRSALATAYTALTGLSTSFGMNIASSSGTSRPSWLDQRNSWVCATNTCTASSCGGYTQTIWSTSLRMGCAISRCNGQENALCLYTPAGNMGQQHPLGNANQCQSVSGVVEETSTHLSNSKARARARARGRASRARGNRKF